MVEVLVYALNHSGPKLMRFSGLETLGRAAAEAALAFGLRDAGYTFCEHVVGKHRGALVYEKDSVVQMLPSLEVELCEAPRELSEEDRLAYERSMDD